MLFTKDLLIHSGGFPYPSIQNEDLLSLLKRGYRMEKPDNCSSDVYVTFNRNMKLILHTDDYMLLYHVAATI